MAVTAYGNIHELAWKRGTRKRWTESRRNWASMAFPSAERYTPLYVYNTPFGFPVVPLKIRLCKEGSGSQMVSNWDKDRGSEAMNKQLESRSDEAQFINMAFQKFKEVVKLTWCSRGRHPHSHHQSGQAHSTQGYLPSGTQSPRTSRTHPKPQRQCPQ